MTNEIKEPGQNSDASGRVEQIVMHDPRTRVIRERLKAWQDEFKTNRYGMAAHSEKYIAALKKELIRLGA